MQLDPNVVRELRELADSGTPPSKLVSIIGSRLGPRDTNFRLLAIAYFREAFALPLADASLVGAASVFPEGPWSDAQLDSQIAPIIQRNRHLWKRGAG
jgi:hypothetical protein